MKPLTSRQQQAVETKVKIARTAMELFYKKGYQQVSVREICDGAGISIGAFYHHYKSKLELLSVGQESIDRIVLSKLPENNGGSVEELLQVLQVGMDVIESYGRPFLSAAYAEILRQGVAYVISQQRPYFQHLLITVNQGMGKGYYREDQSSEDIVMSILRFTRGAIYDWCIRESNQRLSDIVIQDVSLYLNSISPDS